MQTRPAENEDTQDKSGVKRKHIDAQTIFTVQIILLKDDAVCEFDYRPQSEYLEIVKKIHATEKTGTNCSRKNRRRFKGRGGEWEKRESNTETVEDKNKMPESRWQEEKNAAPPQTET